MALAEPLEVLASPEAAAPAERWSGLSAGAVARRVLAAAWPKLAAVALALAVWQAVVWSGWRPEYILPSPFTVLARFGRDLGEADTWQAVATTLRRALSGFALAVVIGGVVGAAVARVRVLRTAVGSLITGLQTMPSIVWFPVAIVLFERSERAILFVVVLGAAPSIANGVIAGIDHVPPTLVRAGRSLGARGLSAWWHVTLPAALPGVVSGLKQGWAFAWRSLMAGELLVIIANRPSIGQDLEFERQFADYTGLYSTMLLVLAIGIIVDALGFGTLDKVVRRHRGLA